MLWGVQSATAVPLAGVHSVRDTANPRGNGSRRAFPFLSWLNRKAHKAKNGLQPPPALPLEEAVRHLTEKVPWFGESLKQTKLGFDSWPCLPRECYAGKDVLDVGCGIGASSAAFLERGANFVWGIDPELKEETLTQLRVLPRSRFTSGVLTP